MAEETGETEEADETEALEQFRHTPFVCGRLGPDDGGHWPALLSAAPTPVRVRSTGRFHAFAASGAPGLERVPGRRAWVWGRHLLSERRPTSWREAAQELGLAGFWVGKDGLRLHTDALGVVAVYARELDGTTYFANRVDPLVRLGAGRLSTDWEAWGEIAHLNGFSHERTGFVEIRRLAFAESRCWLEGRARRVRDVPAWMLVDRLDGSRGDVVEALVGQMPSDRDERSVVGLSAGWDSRMIGVLAAHQGLRPPDAWTAHNDSGTRTDPDLAPAVAEALGMRHRAVGLRSARQWVRLREPHLRRLEHETPLHTWLSPFSAKVREQGAPVWDGLFGDVLFRAAGVSQEVLWAGPLSAQREAQWFRQGGQYAGRFDALRPDVIRRFHDDARRVYYRDGDIFTGLASELTMRVLTAKSARILGCSPTRLVAPEARVRLPFATPDVVAAGAAVPPVLKAQTGWYRELIAELDPAVAALPSSNDTGLVHTPGPPPIHRHPKVLAWQAAAVVSDDVVLSLFTPRAQDHLRNGQALGRTGISMEALQWGHNLALWRSRYREWLTDERL